jgi:serine/threonine protein kinase
LLCTNTERASVDREVLNQRRLCNRHVIRLYETYESEKDLYLVLERAPCGNLDELLFVRRKLSELEAKLVMKQVLDGLLYCHSQGIIHAGKLGVLL